MTFRLLPAGLEETQFKRQPDGWLFTTASPWIFAPRRTYLVNDEQKAALAARVRRGQYLRLAMIIPMSALAGAVFVMAPQLLRPVTLATWLIMGAFVLATTAVIVLGEYCNLRPLLRDMPRTSRKISQLDMLRSQCNALSMKAVAIFTGIFVFAAITNFVGWITSPRGDAFGLITVAFSVVFAVVFTGMLIAKLRARGTEAAH